MSENVFFHSVLPRLTNGSVKGVKRFIEHFVRIRTNVFIEVFGNMIEFDFLFGFADSGNDLVAYEFADLFDLFVTEHNCADHFFVGNFVGASLYHKNSVRSAREI